MKKYKVRYLYRDEELPEWEHVLILPPKVPPLERIQKNLKAKLLQNRMDFNGLEIIIREL